MLAKSGVDLNIMLEVLSSEMFLQIGIEMKILVTVSGLNNVWAEHSQQSAEKLLVAVWDIQGIFTFISSIMGHQ
jgi:hypothetical protein